MTAMTAFDVNNWPVTESTAVNCMPTWHSCEPVYGNVIPHAEPSTCKYIEAAKAGYVNGEPAVPTAPVALSVVGPAITTLFVMSSISMLIEVGITGVFVWSTKFRSMKMSVPGYALTLAYGRIGLPWRYLFPMTPMSGYRQERSTRM